jgi:cytosine deaminase
MKSARSQARVPASGTSNLDRVQAPRSEVHGGFEFAKTHNRRIDLHCDETGDRELVLPRGDGGQHGRGRPDRLCDREPLHLGGLLRALLLLEAARVPAPVGFAQLKELLAEGVNVSLGNDVIIDPWYPMGKAGLIDAAHLALHFTYMSGRDEITEMLWLATERGARTLGVEDRYGIEEGKPADFVIFDAKTPSDVITLRATRRAT